jgi:hypothetical protein
MNLLMRAVKGDKSSFLVLFPAAAAGAAGAAAVLFSGPALRNPPKRLPRVMGLTLVAALSASVLPGVNVLLPSLFVASLGLVNRLRRLPRVLGALSGAAPGDSTIVVSTLVPLGKVALSNLRAGAVAGVCSD